MIPIAALPEVGFVRLPTILQVFPVSRSSWWAGVKKGKYPPGHKLTSHVTAWKAEDIRALLRKAAGDEDPDMRISAHRGRCFSGIVDRVSEERGRRFRLIVDAVSA